MKKLLFLAMTIFLFYSCCENCNQKKEYSFKIYYNCKEKIDTFKWIGYGDNLFRLSNGDLVYCRGTKTLLSGISRYEVISIKKVDTITSAQTNIPAEEKLFHKK